MHSSLCCVSTNTLRCFRRIVIFLKHWKKKHSIWFTMFRRHSHTNTHTHTRTRRQRTTFALKYLWLHQRQLQQATTLRKGNGGMNKKTDKDWQGTSLETWSTLSLLIAFGQILSAFLSLSLVALPHTHTHTLSAQTWMWWCQLFQCLEGTESKREAEGESEIERENER